MLKAKSGTTVIFGITEENVQRLKNGQPLHIDLADLKADGAERIIFFYGADDSDLIRQVQPFIGKNTVIHETPEQ